jgi:hypothetical protein
MIKGMAQTSAHHERRFKSIALVVCDRSHKILLSPIIVGLSINQKPTGHEGFNQSQRPFKFSDLGVRA